MGEPLLHPGISTTEASMNNNNTLYVGLVFTKNLLLSLMLSIQNMLKTGKIGTSPADIQDLCKRLRSKS